MYIFLQVYFYCLGPSCKRFLYNGSWAHIKITEVIDGAAADDNDDDDDDRINNSYYTKHCALWVKCVRFLSRRGGVVQTILFSHSQSVLENKNLPSSLSIRANDFLVSCCIE